MQSRKNAINMQNGKYEQIIELLPAKIRVEINTLWQAMNKLSRSEIIPPHPPPALNGRNLNLWMEIQKSLKKILSSAGVRYRTSVKDHPERGWLEAYFTTRFI